MAYKFTDVLCRASYQYLSGSQALMTENSCQVPRIVYQFNQAFSMLLGKPNSFNGSNFKIQMNN